MVGGSDDERDEHDKNDEHDCHNDGKNACQNHNFHANPPMPAANKPTAAGSLTTAAAAAGCSG